MRYELKSQTPRAVGWFLVKQAEISYNARSERAGRSQTQGTRRQSRLPLVVFKRAIVPRSVPRSCSIKLASLHSYLYSPHFGHRRSRGHKMALTVVTRIYTRAWCCTCIYIYTNCVLIVYIRMQIARVADEKEARPDVPKAEKCLPSR